MMSGVFLGIIAFATLTTAVVECVVILWLVRTARRTWQAMNRLSQETSRLREHAVAVGDNLGRALTVASAQVDRVALVYEAVAVPLERVATAVAVARGISGVVKRRASRRSRRPMPEARIR